MAELESLIEPFGVPFVYSIPPTALRRMEREIGEAAVTEVLTRMSERLVEMGLDYVANDGTGWDVLTWVASYMPTPVPTADEGATE